MKRIINYLKKNILILTIIFIVIYILLGILINLLNYTYTFLTSIISVVIIFIGLIFGTIQLIKKDDISKTEKTIYLIPIILLEIILITPVLIIYMLFKPVETYTTEESKVMYKTTIYKLHNHEINYYKFTNPFIRTKKISISKNPIEIDGTTIYNTTYYDENGKIIKE